MVLEQPYMKGILFKSVIKLKGKEDYRGLSIQNEVPRSQQAEHKEAVERAKSIRTDTGCRTRIKFSNGPVTLTVHYNGERMSEEKFQEKLTTGSDSSSHRSGGGGGLGGYGGGGRGGGRGGGHGGGRPRGGRGGYGGASGGFSSDWSGDAGK